MIHCIDGVFQNEQMIPVDLLYTRTIARMHGEQTHYYHASKKSG